MAIDSGALALALTRDDDGDLAAAMGVLSTLAGTVVSKFLGEHVERRLTD